MRSSEPPPRPTALPLRWHLVLLVVGALLPVVVFAGLVVLRLAGQERVVVERRLAHSARIMAAAVDREMASSVRALQALAESDRLDRGDLAGFHAEAQRVSRTQSAWRAALLLAPDGELLLNTQYPWGAPLFPPRDPESFRRTVATRRPTVGNLALGRRGWAFPIRVPVMRRGELRYVLTAVIIPEALADVVIRQLPPREEWTRTVIDGNGLVVARTREPERFIGRPATASLLARTRATQEEVYRDTTLEGAPAYVAFSHNASSGWTAAVTAPAEVVEGPIRRSLFAVLGLGLALLVLSAAGAYALARQVSRGIASAAAAADALAHGGRPRVEPSGIAEVTRLAEALARSADLLRHRESERDEHLARAEAARAEAEAASRAKDEFLAMLGHELRNPLSPIVTALELLKLRGHAESRELGIVERQVQHLTRLVDDLLDISRITRGKVELKRERVELGAVVAKALEMSSPLIAQRRHRLAVDVPAAGLLVDGDPVRLAQVVSNLLTNAAKYTPPGGNVRVLARGEDGEVTLAVIDDGQGLAPELLPQVFDLFVQGPRALDRQEGGLGIGLTLVRSLVAMHGGRVEAHSEGPGRGSTFLVRLPALAAAPDVEEVTRAAAAG